MNKIRKEIKKDTKNNIKSTKTQSEVQFCLFRNKQAINSTCLRI